MSAGSIQNKLRLAVVAVGVLALCGISTAFLVYQTKSFETTTHRELETLAAIVGAHSAAPWLAQDVVAAERELAALRFDAQVLGACLYDPAGQVFAQYARNADAASWSCPAAKPPGCVKGRGQIDCHFPVYFDEADRARHGTVYIAADTSHFESARQGYVVAALVGLLVLVVCTSVVFESFARASITRPLERLVRGAQTIASGDLTATVPVASQDEIGVLARAFNEMGRGLHAIVSQVRATIGSIASVVASLHKASVQMSDEVRRQERSVEEAADSIARLGVSIAGVSRNAERLSTSATETSSSMLEMNSSIRSITDHMDELAGAIDTASSSVMEMGASTQQIGESVDTLEIATHTTEAGLQQLNSAVVQVSANAQRSQDLSRQTSERAQKGMEAVAEMIRAMDSIQSSFSRLEGTISSLGQRSEAIGSVLRVIDEVVEQTKLLSLNASIIASQAGEHGKAFAVVADEVKNLSDRTAQSTREITQLVKNVQHETTQAVELMGQGSTTVSRGVALSKDAGDALESILECSHLSLQMVNEIVKATSAQNTDIVALGRSVDTVKQIVEQVRRATQEQRHVSTEIMQLVESVRSLGAEVKRATQEQNIESNLISKAMESVMHMIDEIVRETHAQTQGNERLQNALEVFRSMTIESGRIADEMKSMVEVLSDRSQAVNAEIDKFRVEGVERA